MQVVLDSWHSFAKHVSYTVKNCQYTRIKLLVSVYVVMPLTVHAGSFANSSACLSIGIELDTA